MSIKNKVKNFFSLDDEYMETETEVEFNEEEYQESPRPYERERKVRAKQEPQDKSKVVSLSTVQSQAKVILVEPHSYDEAQEIADHLKNRKAVVINLQRITNEQAKRVVDFLSGTVYAIGGDIQKLGTNIFLCTPDNVDVSGSISEIVSDR